MLAAQAAGVCWFRCMPDTRFLASADAVAALLCVRAAATTAAPHSTPQPESRLRRGRCRGGRGGSLAKQPQGLASCNIHSPDSLTEPPVSPELRLLPGAPIKLSLPCHSLLGH